MNLLDSSESFSFEITLSDSRAIEIVHSLPEENRNNILEKYIILGDMVVSHATISTRKESVEQFFSPLRTDIQTIREQIQKIVPTLSIPAEKGRITVEAIFESYQEHFMDDSFEDVSIIGKYSDIVAVTEFSEPILIELKDYSDTVPTSQVDKFWRDMEVRNAKYGIFISMRSKIAKCSSCINIQKNMNRTGIFIVNDELNWKGHLFAFYVIKKLIEIEKLKKEDMATEEINKSLNKIFVSVQEIKKLTDSINTIYGTIDEIKTLTGTRLDKITSTLNIYKKNLDEQLTIALGEFEKVEMK